MKRMDVLVVGSGPGGLAAAINLAGLGLSVQVIDKDPTVGGRMRGLTLGDGAYQVDTGPTIMQCPQLYEQLFARAGKNLADYVKLQPVDPNTRLHFWDGSKLDTSRDIVRMRAELQRFGPEKPDAFVQWLAEAKEKYALAYEKFITVHADSLDYYNPLRLLPTLRHRPWESLYTHLNRWFHDDRITYALSYPSKYLGLHPTTCSSVFSLIPYIELAFGVWHVEGGFRALARGMRRCAEDLGATFRMNEPVAQLWIENETVRGVILTSGERVEADAVVMNADLPYAATKLIPSRYRRTSRISDFVLERAKYSCSTFMWYLGLDRRYDQLPHHLIYLSNAARRTDREALEDRTVNLEDPPFYVCNPTATDPSGAPDGHSTLYVLVPVPNTGHAVDWKRVERTYLERLPRWLEKVGIHGVEKHIRAQVHYTAETWSNDYNVFRGAVFNLSHTWLQLGGTRPRVKNPNLEGLYFVGGGTHPGSGLLTILESANIAADYLSRAHGKGPLRGWPYVPGVHDPIEVRSRAGSRTTASATPVAGASAP